MPRLPQITLRQFGFGLLTVGIVIGFLAILWIEAVGSREREIRFAEAHLRNLSRVLERHTLATVEKIDVTLQAAVRELAPVVAGEEKPGRPPDQLLAEMLESIPESQSLRIFGADGNPRFDASGVLRKVNIADRAYFQRNRDEPQAGLVISGPIFARVTSNWVITLSRRLENRKGEFVGLVQAAIRADYFEGFYKTLDVGEHGMIALYDQELRLIARHPVLPDSLGARLQGSRVEGFLDEGMRDKVYQTVSQLDGIDRIYSFRRLEGFPFVIMVGESRDDVLVEWSRKAGLYGAAALMLSLMLLGLVVLWQLNYRLAIRRAKAMAGAYDETVRHMLALLNSLPDAAWLKDRDGRFIAINDAYAREAGRPAGEIIGRTVFDVWPFPVAKAFDRLDREALATQSRIDSDGSRRLPDGSRRFYEYTRTPVRDDSGRIIGIAGVARDVSERTRAEQRIRYLAEYDQLTDLPNRVVLGERVAEMISGPLGGEQPLALLMLDLDHFKNINETLGHDVGDSLLQQVARRLKGMAGERVLVSRHGGDKFAFLLAGGGAVAAAQFAQQLIETVKQPCLVDGQEFSLSSTIGIAIHPQDGADFPSLLKNADAAMYHAKSAGRGGFQFFSPEMNVRVLERLSMETNLRKAVARQEFRVYYQPKFSMADGRLTGFEALLRWPHPEEGMIPPGRFIPVAEDTQLIGAIGEWVLLEVCRQNRAWQLAGYEPVPVAVNLSMAQFRQRNLVDVVSGVLRETGLPPACLELEITESVVMHDSEQVIGVLDQLKRLGVLLSIDDFGTGYSSLSYLKRFPIDKIKIDRSFVQPLPAAGNDAAIVETIIAIAGKLELGVIAEGVETMAQLDYLKERGCDEAQGFLFSPAVPAGEALCFMNRRADIGVASPASSIHGGAE